MSRPKGRAARFGVQVGLVLALSVASQNQDRGVAENQTPTPILLDANGRMFSLRQFVGAPLVLSFVSLPERAIVQPDPNRSQVVFLRSMVEQYRHRGLQAAVAVCANAAEFDGGFRLRVVNFQHDSGLADLPVFADGFGHFSAAFGVREFPTTLLIDNSLSIEKRWDGVALPSQLSSAIEAALRNNR